MFEGGRTRRVHLPLLTNLSPFYPFLINCFHTLNILRKIYHLIFFNLSVFLKLYVYIGTYICTGISQRTLDVLPYYSQPYSPETGSHWTGARVLASKPLGSTCLCPNSGGAGLQVCLWLNPEFCVGPGDLSLGPQACTASTVRSCFPPKKLNCKIVLTE